MSPDAMIEKIRKAAEGDVSVSDHGRYTEVTAKVAGIVTVYVLAADGTVLGRSEQGPAGSTCYARGSLKGGSYLGSRLTHDEFLSRIGA